MKALLTGINLANITQQFHASLFPVFKHMH